MRQGFGRRLDRLAVQYGGVEAPRLVIVFEEVDACGCPLVPVVQETTSEARPGVTFVYRASPTVVVIGERADGPLYGAASSAIPRRPVSRMLRVARRRSRLSFIPGRSLGGPQPVNSLGQVGQELVPRPDTPPPDEVVVAGPPQPVPRRETAPRCPGRRSTPHGCAPPSSWSWSTSCGPLRPCRASGGILSH